MSRVAFVLPLLSLLAACEVRPYARDPEEVMARYQFTWPATCSSWLRSSITGYRYCASPPFKVAVDLPQAGGPKVEPSAKDGKVDEASLMANGEKVYAEVCQACHGPDGKGTPGAFPPLAGAGGYYGDPQNHARIVVKGLSGPITVAGVAFNGAMPPQGHLTDYQLASVLTYERNSFGNHDGVVTPADVAAVR
jgi:mono/diheme cytochrome c family protein